MTPSSRPGGREGVTTGTCAAAAAKAAALLLRDGQCPPRVMVTGPTGRMFSLPVFPVPGGARAAQVPAAGVVKDAGDDADATDGMTVCASVEPLEGEGPILFAAGEGVGTVTLPGMKLPPGEPAINPGPRKMIEDAVRGVLGSRPVRVTVSIPGGEAVARRTFNPRLGIAGGLSVLGTTGVVRPMDEASLLASLDMELSVLRALGVRDLVMTFGHTGETALRRALGVTGRCVIQVGNYPGHVLDEAARRAGEGPGLPAFRRGLLCGHPGKLLKVAAGSFNTHNRVADGRIEALCTHAALAGARRELIQRLYACRTTENAIKIVSEENLSGVWTSLADAAARRCTKRSFGEFPVEAAFIDNEGNILGCTPGALAFRGLSGPEGDEVK
ncbi:MAG: cobalamin biosynthesis protein CbiD [Fretibacterium sp.]|nr:cobalamin biosynthesis protein CbiD [Fretibacterium sp.]